MTKTVRNVRKEIRANFNAPRTPDEGAGGNGVVRAQGEVRGPVDKAVTDVVNACVAASPTRTPPKPTTRRRSVAKSLGDTARKVVKDVRQAAKDARDAAKDRTAAGDDDE